MTLNFGVFEVRFSFWQTWQDWIWYKDYKWHNFTLINLAVVDNYPFHGRFHLEISFGLLGLNVLMDIESTKERDKDSDIMNVLSEYEEVRRYKDGEDSDGL